MEPLKRHPLSSRIELDNALAAICEGDTCAAAIINELPKSRNDDGWVRTSAVDIAERMLLGFYSRNTVLKSLALLKRLGFIETKTVGESRTHSLYRVNTPVVNAAIEEVEIGHFVLKSDDSGSETGHDLRSKIGAEADLRPNFGSLIEYLRSKIGAEMSILQSEMTDDDLFRLIADAVYGAILDRKPDLRSKNGPELQSNFGPRSIYIDSIESLPIQNQIDSSPAIFDSPDESSHPAELDSLQQAATSPILTGFFDSENKTAKKEKVRCQDRALATLIEERIRPKDHQNVKISKANAQPLCESLPLVSPKGVVSERLQSIIDDYTKANSPSPADMYDNDAFCDGVRFRDYVEEMLKVRVMKRTEVVKILANPFFERGGELGWFRYLEKKAVPRQPKHGLFLPVEERIKVYESKLPLMPEEKRAAQWLYHGLSLSLAKPGQFTEEQIRIAEEKRQFVRSTIIRHAGQGYLDYVNYDPYDSAALLEFDFDKWDGK